MYSWVGQIFQNSGNRNIWLDWGQNSKTKVEKALFSILRFRKVMAIFVFKKWQNPISRFVKKAHKKSYWQKTHNFWTLSFFWWKLQFFVNIFFLHFVTKLLRIFWYLKVPFWAKRFLKTKIAITMRILKIEKSAFSTLVLEFWPQSNHIFRFPGFLKKAKDRKSVV